MDKYQRKILARGVYIYLKDSKEEYDGDPFKAWPADSLTIQQDADYHKTHYCLSIVSILPLEIFVGRKGRWSKNDSFMDKSLPHEDTFAVRWNIDIDFDDRIDQIKIAFLNNIADDCVIDLNYQESDKEAFDKMKEQEDEKALIQSMNVRVTTGESLINVMFSEASSNVAKTIVTLYMRDNQNGRSLMGTFPVEQGMMFKSISGLAFGRYSIKVAQVDAKDQFIAASDYVDVELRQPNYGGKPVIRP